MDKLEEKIAELIEIDKEIAKQIKELKALMTSDDGQMEYVV